jgi:hypothetical protein
MFGERAMTGLAIYMRMFALRLHIQNISMAGLAGLMAGKPDRTGCDLANGGSAIVPILAKAFRDNVVADHQEDEKCQDKEPGKSEKMSCILEGAHEALSP